MVFISFKIYRGNILATLFSIILGFVFVGGVMFFLYGLFNLIKSRDVINLLCVVIGAVVAVGSYKLQDALDIFDRKCREMRGKWHYMKYVKKQVKVFKSANDQKVLKGGTSNDTIFISKGEKWKVYSLNHLGELRDEKVFDSKEDACKNFVSEIKIQVYRRPAK